MAEPIILDASAWLAVLLKEDESDKIEHLIEDRSLFAPELIYYEVSNGILFAKRSGRPSFRSDSLVDFLDFIFEFPIRVVPKEIWWGKAIQIIQNYDLTFYDAAYVACSKTLQLPLLTLDRKINQVLKKERLQVI